MLHVIDTLDRELDELIIFGNQMLDSLAMAEKFGWDTETILNETVYLALLIEEKEDQLEELAWRQFGLAA